MLTTKTNIYILTDHAKFGGTHTWATNVSDYLTELGARHAVINTVFYDFELESVIVCNNYNHKIFKNVNKDTLSTLKIYFVVHGIPNPSKKEG